MYSSDAAKVSLYSTVTLPLDTVPLSRVSLCFLWGTAAFSAFPRTSDELAGNLQ